MSKRPPVDFGALSSLTNDVAAPMQEATQRTAAITSVTRLPTKAKKLKAAPERVRTEDLVPMAFKVAPDFQVRFKVSAAKAGMKMNELLFAAYDAWAEKHERNK